MRDGGVDNNFQGRYTIRHAWTGPDRVREPAARSWGGPPDGAYGGTQPQAAKGLATAPRGKIALGRPQLARRRVPLLGSAGKRPPVRSDDRRA